MLREGLTRPASLPRAEAILVFFHEVIHGLIVLEGLEQGIVLRIGKGAVFVATDHAIFPSQQATQATLAQPIAFPQCLHVLGPDHAMTATILVINVANCLAIEVEVGHGSVAVIAHGNVGRHDDCLSAHVVRFLTMLHY